MEDKIREARITLGTKTYLLRTALSAEQFDKIASFSRNLFSSLDPGADQEKRLLLGWMYMAYKLQQTAGKLDRMLEEFKLPSLEDSASESGTEGGNAE